MLDGDSELLLEKGWADWLDVGGTRLEGVGTVEGEETEASLDEGLGQLEFDHRLSETSEFLLQSGCMGV